MVDLWNKSTKFVWWFLTVQGRFASILISNLVLLFCATQLYFLSFFYIWLSKCNGCIFINHCEIPGNILQLISCYWLQLWEQLLKYSCNVYCMVNKLRGYADVNCFLYSMLYVKSCRDMHLNKLYSPKHIRKYLDCGDANMQMFIWQTRHQCEFEKCVKAVRYSA